MNTVGQKERQTQDRIVTLFQHALQYEYLGNWEEREGNSNIEEELLQKNLRDRGYSDTLIQKALFELQKVAGDKTQSLYDQNKSIYAFLRYGVKIKEGIGKQHQTVWLVDWSEPMKNNFAIAEEVTVQGEHTKRPDIVIYLNGIAVGVLELKRSTVSLTEGIRQNLDNQKAMFIKPFFSTMQLVMAGNDTEGLRYGTIETPEKHYLTWKEPSDIENKLDRAILQLCAKSRLLEMLHDFVVFDSGYKKLCRHNQYFGVKAAQDHIRRKEGGIIWHTQGSGKSLTMVWLAKWIRENVVDPRVLIITDRDELDKQIKKVFSGVQEDMYRTQSGADLISKLNVSEPWLLCSLVHKFGRKEKADEAEVEQYAEELLRNLPKNFKAKGNITVFVDECHRTQSGKLHKAMKKILPDALFIGFTGTPLLKKNKKKSIEMFGKYIHTYKYDEAVKDKVVLDLGYEARNIEQNITSPEKIDQWFDAKTRGLTDVAKVELKKRWGTMRKVLSSQSRLEKIVADILLDMETRDRLQSGRGNAMLVSGSIYQACKYYELFQSAGFTKCAIVTSYEPNPQDIKGETTGEDSLTERLKQYEIYQKMLGGKDAETFEEEVKKKFIEEPGQMKLLIVVDKLLTGFDAPSATYLYIDKKMQDHGLFQAICRVNRLDGEDKEYGFIIDYKDLFKSLEKAVDDYTSEVFDTFDKEDVAGILENRLQKGKQRLDEALESIKALCEPVTEKTTVGYTRYFCGNSDNPEELKETEAKRIMLYKQTSSLIRAYANIANEMQEAGYTLQEVQRIKEEVTHYEQVRTEMKLASGDYIDLKVYEPAMRHLIDRYISAQESEVMSAFDDFTLVDLILKRGGDIVKALPRGIGQSKEAMAETIENNVRRLIIDEMPTNPKYYERMSILLDEIIRERKTEAKSYEEYLAKIVALTKKVRVPEGVAAYPSSLRTIAQKALYDNLEQNEALALKLDELILASKQDGWLGNPKKQRQVRNAIQPALEKLSNQEFETIFEIIKYQHEYR